MICANGLSIRSIRLPSLTVAPLQPPVFPSLPAGLGQVFTYQQIANAEKTSHRHINYPLNHAPASEQRGQNKPATGTHNSSTTAREHLSWCVVIQVDSTNSNTGRTEAKAKSHSRPKVETEVRVGACIGWTVSEREEKRQVDGKISHKLGVG